ncbi:MAG: Gfo/Idh/MocA family oxidoreductase [Gammaproteobacteria bacterium]|jgi:predicted dehydrogenase|nr:Gfo/Idh/MocA family oxidoreductase [Gammaproteobacteria bacterium]MBT6754948.1 Gfo/Idh/MocA family oxidoreductase [Gammaproteobacteria bacterium]MBT7523983.1 Gfo/Idh/MocA family oxidoreductase [Gammaproteobacteria bacterium]MBT7814920.1 Gfo/Idh/MocA family oxidoreductase [Gammaproteobacteria bacterium]
MSKVKIAVIGIGYLGEFHAQKYKANKDADLIGVVDTNKQRSEEISNKIGVKSYNDYKSIIDQVDAVSIVVPTNLHYKIAKFFIENKKHVLIEKPFASNTAEARKLKNISEKNQTILQIGHLERFNKAFVELKDKVKNPLFIECNRISPFKIRGTEVDVIMDLMIHDLDIIMSINKSKIKNIHASGISVLTNKTDIANARIVFEDNCVCNLSSSRISDKIERKMRVFQKNSYFSLDYQNSSLGTYKKIKNKNVISIEKKEKSFPQNDSLKDEIDSFVKCIKNNKKAVVDASDGLNALTYALKISNLIKK